jgi:phospholipase C
MRLDPMHEHVNVMRQLENDGGGFVLDLEASYRKSKKPARPVDFQEIMGYYPCGFLPALHTLAKEFTICDRWFSSLPGPTWPNRFFALTGTSSGSVTMPAGWSELDPAPYFQQKQPTIFSRLNEAGRRNRIYFYDFPCSLVLVEQRQRTQLANYHSIDRFFEDAKGDESNFPEFAFIEPKYFGADQNDNHPPHNVMKSEKLVADVYNAIRSNAALWNSTLLVVAFDEHGGFYDHVTPPRTVAPDEHIADFAFDRLGVRVPALLISPWVGARTEHTEFDHTSLLRYLVDKWQLGPLGARTAQANSIACALRTSAPPREDTTTFIRVATTDLIPDDPEMERWDSSAGQRQLHIFADWILEGGDHAVAKGVATAAAWTRRELGWLSRQKRHLGDLFIKAGTALNRDLKESRNKRIERTRQAVEHLKSRTAGDTGTKRD